jgi:uncharacterized oligopeptide transporter (OPT) family protein
MAFGIGYIIGPLYMGMWFIGSVFGNIFLVPAGVALKWFANPDLANAFKSSLGIGMIIGGGAGILIKDILPRARTIFFSVFENREERKLFARLFPIVAAIIVAVLTAYFKINIILSIVVIVGVWITVGMAAYIDGATGIDPLEIFGIIVLLVVRWIANFFTPMGIIPLFAVAGVVSVACGLAGDNFQDFKSGQILKTNPKAQILSELFGGLVGAVTSVVALFVMHRVYGAMGPNTNMPAPQAYAVSLMIKGLPSPSGFFTGFLAGLVLYFFKIPSAIIGIGIYLPFIISGTAFLGGAVRIIVKKWFPKQDENGTLISSGLLGGEGFTGVLIAIIKFLTIFKGG